MLKRIVIGVAVVFTFILGTEIGLFIKQQLNWGPPENLITKRHASYDRERDVHNQIESQVNQVSYGGFSVGDFKKPSVRAVSRNLEIAAISRDLWELQQLIRIRQKQNALDLKGLDTYLDELESSRTLLAEMVSPPERPEIPTHPLIPETSENQGYIAATVNTAAQLSGLTPQEIELMLQ